MTNPETPYEIATRILNAERIGSPGPFLPPSDLYRLARAVIELQEERRTQGKSEAAFGDISPKTKWQQHGANNERARIVAALLKRANEVTVPMNLRRLALWIKRGCPDE